MLKWLKRLVPSVAICSVFGTAVYEEGSPPLFAYVLIFWIAVIFTAAFWATTEGI